MFMLGEMAAHHPDSGSFSTYASTYLGDWAGYAVGWLYWFKWMITVTLQALLLGAIIHDFVPAVPLVASTFAILLLVFSMNIYSVNVFGEFEYWLTFIKIAAIVIFLILGVSVFLGVSNRLPSPGLTNLTSFGGFVPNGISPVLAGVVVVIFSFGGCEIAAIAAGESENPQKNVVQAIRSVISRVLVLYVGSVSILVLCLPWTDKVALQSPYVSLFSMAGLPAVAIGMRMVLFISFLTVMNSGMYTASRMLFSLSQRGFAPALFNKTTVRSVPFNALTLSLLICSVVLLVYFFIGGDFFLMLAESSGSLIIIVWLFIIFSHLAMRRQLDNVPQKGKQIKIWFSPYSNWLTIGVLTIVLLSQVTNPNFLFQFWFTFIVVIVITGSYFIKQIIWP
jgi:GABA permease